MIVESALIEAAQCNIDRLYWHISDLRFAKAALVIIRNSFGSSHSQHMTSRHESCPAILLDGDQASTSQTDA